MEDLDLDEPIVDIDDCDKKNPLAVTEYIDDIYAYYKKTEVKTFLLLVFLILLHGFSVKEGLDSPRESISSCSYQFV